MHAQGHYIKTSQLDHDQIYICPGLLIIIALIRHDGTSYDILRHTLGSVRAETDLHTTLLSVLSQYKKQGESGPPTLTFLGESGWRRGKYIYYLD